MIRPAGSMPRSAWVCSRIRSRPLESWAMAKGELSCARVAGAQSLPEPPPATRTTLSAEAARAENAIIVAATTASDRISYLTPEFVGLRWRYHAEAYLKRMIRLDSSPYESY